MVKGYDGKEGVSKLEETAYDVLFTGFIMPKIDGKQLIEYTRRKFCTNRFPIIAVSAKEKIEAVQARLVEARIGGLPVVEDEQIVEAVSQQCQIVN